MNLHCGIRFISGLLGLGLLSFVLKWQKELAINKIQQVCPGGIDGSH